MPATDTFVDALDLAIDAVRRNCPTLSVRRLDPLNVLIGEYLVGLTTAEDRFAPAAWCVWETRLCEAHVGGFEIQVPPMHDCEDPEDAVIHAAMQAMADLLADVIDAQASVSREGGCGG